MHLSDEPPYATRRKRVVYARVGPRQPDLDWVAVEEPLAVSVAGARMGVLMRTPGADEDLGYGFALTEGIVGSPADLVRAYHPDADENVLVLVPHPSATPDLTLARRGLVVSSSCGVCGKLTVAQISGRCAPVRSWRHVPVEQLCMLSAALEKVQVGFVLTGGHHAAALVTPAGNVVLVREDIGRHNAVDKVVGAAVRAGMAPSDYLLFVSGRCSFEIVQKAAMVGIGLVAAVGAASSLAIDLACELGVTLCAFVRSERLCIYGGEGVADEEAF